MYVKIENNEIIYPLQNKETENGLICNYWEDKEMLEADGFQDYTDEQIQELITPIEEIE